MRSVALIECWEARYVYMNLRVAYLLFQSSPRHQMAKVAFCAEVAPVVVKVHPCHCASSMSMDFVLWHFSKEGSTRSEFRERLLGGF
jgi:hypothetical protein